MLIYKNSRFYIGRTDLYSKVLFNSLLSKINDLLTRGLALNDCKGAVTTYSDIYFDVLNDTEIEIECNSPFYGLNTLYDKVNISFVIHPNASFRCSDVESPTRFTRININKSKFIKLGDIYINFKERMHR